ncbi:MAG: DUF2267 domain-containing protein [Novosphingobium sp.]
MSATGLEVFDKTLHATHTWLGEITSRLGPDKHLAWRSLGAVLHVLRDRLPADLSAHLGAQLPLLVRGLYYDQYEPSRQPSQVNSSEDFVAEVERLLEDTRTVGPKDAIEAVLNVLDHHVSAGQIEKVRHALPKGLATLWPEKVT